SSRWISARSTNSSSEPFLISASTGSPHSPPTACHRRSRGRRGRQPLVAEPDFSQIVAPRPWRAEARGMARETELYKDKIEVSLDGRQIFYLFFGGAVIVGMVFVLGVMVGRRVEARGHVERAQVAATVDPLAALDRLEGGSALSFQGALRGEAGAASA